MSQLTGAPIKMHKQGLSTDSATLKIIERRPGATIAEIAQDLQWTNGKVDGSVMRLTAENKVTIKHILKRGMLIKKVYPKGYAKEASNKIEIPKELVNIEAWKQQAFVYALSRTTIGLAPRKTVEWNSNAFFQDTVCIAKSDEKIVLELPTQLAEFYQLVNSEISLSSVGDLVFVTVESVLPVVTQE